MPKKRATDAPEPQPEPTPEEVRGEDQATDELPEGVDASDRSVGETWEIPVDGPEDRFAAAPTVEVSGPFGSRTFTASRLPDGKYVVYVALTQPGLYILNRDGDAVEAVNAN